MKIQLGRKPLSEIKDSYIVLPVFEDNKEDYGQAVVKSFLNETPKFGKLFETETLYSGDSKILLIGAGKKEKFEFITMQNLAGAMVRKLLRKSKYLRFG